MKEPEKRILGFYNAALLRTSLIVNGGGFNCVYMHLVLKRSQLKRIIFMHKPND